MKLLLVRHGESTWNVEGRYQGRMDPPLSVRGEQQADALAAYAAAHAASRPKSIVASPLLRARQTADIVAGRLELPVQVDDRIIEVSHGAWEGLLKRDVERRWPEMMAAWRNAPETVVFPGGESLSDVVQRWRSFLSDAQGFPSPLMLVTHDVIVRLAVLEARGKPASQFNSLTAENAALTELDDTSGGLRLVRFNEQSYLGTLRADPATQAL